MRKISFVLLLVVVLFIGILIGKPGGSSLNITQDELDQFEEEIENGEYHQKYQGIEPNAINNIGKKVEEILDKVFGRIVD